MHSSQRKSWIGITAAFASIGVAQVAAATYLVTTPYQTVIGAQVQAFVGVVIIGLGFTPYTTRR